MGLASLANWWKNGWRLATRWAPELIVLNGVTWSPLSIEAFFSSDGHHCLARCSGFSSNTIKHTPSFPTFIQSLFGQEWKKIQTRWTLHKPLTNCVSFSVTYMRYGGSLSMVAEGIFTKIGKRFGVQKNWAIRQKRTNPLASIITILSGWAVGVSNQSPKRKVFRVPWIKPLLSFGEAGSLQGIAC